MPLPLAPPAKYYPVSAIAYATPEGGVPIDAAHPLPVDISPGAAGIAPLAGSLSASGLVGPFAPRLGRPIWLSLAGTWSGSVTLKRSIDGGATKLPLNAGGQPWATFNGNACEQVAEETEAGAAYYLQATIASGTLAYRVAQ